MKKIVLLIGAAITLARAEVSAKEATYGAPDAGCMVYSVGTSQIGMKFDFPYRRVRDLNGAAVNDWPGRIEPKVGGAILLKIKDPDFSGQESGHVKVRCLPPGSYEVGSFRFGGFLPGVGGFAWSAKKPFALYFRIKPGEATYIGSFVRAPSLGSPLEASLGAAGYFVIADRSARDLPIATGRLPQGMVITNEVTDVSSFGMTAVRTEHPN